MSSENPDNNEALAKVQEAKDALEKSVEDLSENGIRKEILELIPDKDDKDKAAILMATYEEKFSGPLPHPNHLAAYEQTLPGAADRILTMAEKQQNHRMNLENQVIPSEVQINKRGQLFAFIMGLVLIAASTATILHGSVTAGTILILVIFLGYLTVYMGGKVSMKADMKKKKVSGEFDPKK